MTAREYFEQVAAAERDLRRARERLDVADEALDGLVGRSAPGPLSKSTPTSWGLLSRVEAREAALEGYADRLDRLVAVEDEALGVIDRVRPENVTAGARMREALQYRFLSLMTATEAAEVMHCSVASVNRFTSDALDWVDSHGVCDMACAGL